MIQLFIFKSTNTGQGKKAEGSGKVDSTGNKV